MTVRNGPSNDPELRLGFSGHQTFPFRYGWLTKAIDAAEADAGVFRREDALVLLGVGKNMVESIRHWSLATQMLQDSDRGRQFHRTVWAELLFGQGLDFYLEDPASLWLIHWLLVSNPQKAAVWYIAFNSFPYPEFQRESLAAYVVDFALRREINSNERTVARDVDCFVRTYAPARGSKRNLMEDTFNCPLTELGLLQLQPDGVTYQFSIGPKPTLPVEIVAAAVDRFFDIAGGTRESLSFQECLYHPLSPGQVFKLDQSTLSEYLSVLSDITDGAMTADETAGLSQLYRRGSIDPLELINRYYRRQLL
jgi:hypothetical protein